MAHGTILLKMPEIYEAPPETKKRKPTDYSQVMRDFPASTNMLSSFIVRPAMMSMGILEESEVILLIVRKHFVTNLKWIVLVILMTLVPVIASFTSIPFLPGKFIAATTILWYLLVLGIFLNNFLSWFYNANIITDERIIDIDFRNIVYKNVSTAKISNVEDVTVQMGGAVQNMLDYGTILMQTAAEKAEFEFDDIPHPQKVAKLLNELMLEEEQEQLDGRVS